MRQPADLSNRFVQDRIGRAREVQTAHFGSHRQSQRPRAGAIENGLGKTLTFASEYENVFVTKCDIPDRFRSVFCEIPHSAHVELAAQFGPVIDNLVIKMLPIVHRGSFQVLLVEAEAEGPNEPQLGTESNTCPSDVSCVLWNLGLKENAMQHVGKSS